MSHHRSSCYRPIQSISASLLIGFWRWSFGVATGRQLGNIEHFRLWEAPWGLAFFDPMLVGDACSLLNRVSPISARVGRHEDSPFSCEPDRLRRAQGTAG